MLRRENAELFKGTGHTLARGCVNTATKELWLRNYCNHWTISHNFQDRIPKLPLSLSEGWSLHGPSVLHLAVKKLCAFIRLTHLVVRLELELPELTAGTAEGSPAPETSSLQEREEQSAEKTRQNHLNFTLNIFGLFIPKCWKPEEKLIFRTAKISIPGIDIRRRKKVWETKRPLCFLLLLLRSCSR